MKKILVIDDEQFILDSVTKVLNNEGYKTLTAKTITDARILIEIEKPDLVITDIMVPHLGGFEIVEEMKINPETKDIPVILITGMDKEILANTRLETNACISKPFSSETLVTTVKKYV
jgi:DNA-binding response OmpR family regulator